MMTRTTGAALLLSILCAAGCGGGGTPSDPAVDVGFTPQARANTHSAGEQQTPSVARDAAGDMVVVWDSVGQDGSLSGIFGQRYRNGTPVGPEFQANTYTINKQNQPAVAMDGSGNFVAVWRSSGQQGNGGTIYGQRFAADGTRRGGEFQIGPATSDFDSMSDPAVAMNQAGQFAAAWSNRELSQAAAAGELNAYEQRYIEARAYNADGTPVGDATTVYTNISVQRAPAIGIDSAGNFTVVWLNDSVASLGNTVINPRGVYMQRYNALMLPQGVPTHVSDAAGASDRPAMAMNPAGQYIITWERAVDQTELNGIYARRYSALGLQTGPQFQIDTGAAGFYERSSVGLDSTGRFTVVAQSKQTSGGSSVYLQRYAADDTVIGGPTRISDEGFAAMFGKIAVDPDGHASLAWQSYGQDGDGRGIFARAQ